MTLGPHIYRLFGQDEPRSNNVQQIEDLSKNLNGGFGRVYKVALTDEGREMWLRRGEPDCGAAVKVLYGHKWCTERHLMLALREAWIWCQLKHRNIVPFWGIVDYQDLYTGAPSQVCLLSPWAQFGNLEEFSQAPEVGDKHSLSIVLDVVRGLCYLHSHKPNPIVHGDLKGNNILITADPHGSGPRAQLCDFGLSRMPIGVDSNLTTTSTIFNGNERWLAWERMDPAGYDIPHSVAAVTTASDMFELMRTLLQFVTRRVPYHGENEWQVRHHILKAENPSRPDDFADPMGDFLWKIFTQCWSTERALRYDSGAIMTIWESLAVIDMFTAGSGRYIRNYVQNEITFQTVPDKWSVLQRKHPHLTLPFGTGLDLVFDENDLRVLSVKEFSRLVPKTSWDALELRSDDLRLMQESLSQLEDPTLPLRHLDLRYTATDALTSDVQSLRLDGGFAPALETLRLERVPLHWDGLLLQSTRLPVLDRLALRTLRGEGVQAITAHTHMPLLRRLTLFNLNCDTTTVRGLLKSLPSVQVLTLYVMDALLELLMDDDLSQHTSVGLLPSLQTLWAVAYPGFTLEQFVRHRKRLGHPLKRIYVYDGVVMTVEDDGIVGQGIRQESRESVLDNEALVYYARAKVETISEAGGYQLRIGTGQWYEVNNDEFS